MSEGLLSTGPTRLVYIALFEYGYMALTQYIYVCYMAVAFDWVTLLIFSPFVKVDDMINFISKQKFSSLQQVMRIS